jgi:drug/metabolite transporter (DMT)-like permease
MLVSSPPPRRHLRRQGLFTGIAVILFGAGVVLLFYALYHDGDRIALIAAALLLLATIICWAFSAVTAPSDSLPR